MNYQGNFLGGLRGFNEGSDRRIIWTRLIDLTQSGILGMCKGELRRIGIPPSLAFGGETRRVYGTTIPAHSWLVRSHITFHA